VQEHRDTAGAEVRNHEVLDPEPREVATARLEGVVSRRRVAYAGVERTGSRVAQMTLAKPGCADCPGRGRGNQQIGSAVAIDVRDSYGVRHINGRQAVVGAVVATGEGAEQHARAVDAQQATSASVHIHSPYLRAQDL